MVQAESVLMKKQIDLLYLDNTYLDPAKTFPTRETAIQMCISLIKERPNRRIFIGNVLEFDLFDTLKASEY